MVLVAHSIKPASRTLLEKRRAKIQTKFIQTNKNVVGRPRDGAPESPQQQVPSFLSENEGKTKCASREAGPLCSGDQVGERLNTQPFAPNDRERRLTVIVGMRVRPSELKTETKRMSMYVYECDVR